MAVGLDWFAGWSPGIAAENRAAAGGRAALEAHWAQAEPEDMGAFFTQADMAALDGSWSWLAGVAGQAMEQGNEGFLEDTLASVQPWGFRPDAIRVPALIMHGAEDKMVPRAHGEWLAARCPAAESRIVPDGSGRLPGSQRLCLLQKLCTRWPSRREPGRVKTDRCERPAFPPLFARRKIERRPHR